MRLLDLYNNLNTILIFYKNNYTVRTRRNKYCPNLKYLTALCIAASHHKQLNCDLKGITFVVLAVHEKVALMSSS